MYVCAHLCNEMCMMSACARTRWIEESKPKVMMLWAWLSMLGQAKQLHKSSFIGGLVCQLVFLRFVLLNFHINLWLSFFFYFFNAFSVGHSAFFSFKRKRIIFLSLSVSAISRKSVRFCFGSNRELLFIRFFLVFLRSVFTL